LARAETIVGKSAAEWRIKNMKTKWGTCNIRARRIWLNLQLAKYPVSCLEYIIIHELTHLWECYHNAHFKSLMDKFCPDWRERKKIVNTPLEFSCLADADFLDTEDFMSAGKFELSNGIVLNEPCRKHDVRHALDVSKKRL